MKKGDSLVVGTSLAIELVERGFGLCGRDLSNVNVAEMDLRTVPLQFDPSFGDEGRLAIEVFAQRLAVHSLLLTQPDRHARANHFGPESIPRADRVVGLEYGPFARERNRNGFNET